MAERLVRVADPADADPDPVALLESARIQWRRDWDAIALGFLLGALSTLAVQVVW